MLNKPTSYGTSYSDEAAIRARNMAQSIKNADTTIFSIGVDVGGQTIQQYITQSENANGYSVVDRTGTSYEIGDPRSTESYKNWLSNSIGSGYYYDSTNTEGLKAAYDQIFETIKTTIENASKADWVASDPMPVGGGEIDAVEFIGLYDKNKIGYHAALSGANQPGDENTASFAADEITWDLKQSGYTTETGGGTTTYIYTLRYRVRLQNEQIGFIERKEYETNGKTTLKYRVIETVNGKVQVSDQKELEFPIPSVEGYLGELTFLKQDNRGNALAGAEFTLTHSAQLQKLPRRRRDIRFPCCPAGWRSPGTNGEGEALPAFPPDTATICRRRRSRTDTPKPESTMWSRWHMTRLRCRSSVPITMRRPGRGATDGTGVIVNNTYYALPSTGGSGTRVVYSRRAGAGIDSGLWTVPDQTQTQKGGYRILLMREKAETFAGKQERTLENHEACQENCRLCAGAGDGAGAERWRICRSGQ